MIGDYDGAADGDAVLHFNFRPDRARQLVRALGEPDFDEFPRREAPELRITTLTEYRQGWEYPVAFPPHAPEATLAEVIARRGERQLHVAETEKYAHVTYFFNGGREAEWEGEERCLVPSARDVPTYDHKPEMSAGEAAEAFRSRWSEDGYRFGIINFANPDMVGHTGDIPAAVTGGGDRRPLPGRGGVGGPRLGRRLHRHRRPRQRRQHAGARRLAEHGPLDQPRAADRHGRRSCRWPTAGSSPTSPRRRSPCSGSSSRPEMTGRSLLGRCDAARIADGGRAGA